jgi:hypothetical protein
MTSSTYLCGLLLCFLAVWQTPAPAVGAVAPTATKDVVETADGNYQMCYRAPAQEADLGMPIYPRGTVTESLAYRVRNRHNFDLLALARVRLSSPRNCEEIRRYYLAAFGAGTTQHTDKRTGEITLAAGKKDHFRLVVITPSAQGCALQLEQVQQFTPPARVYTPDEQRVVALLNGLLQHYHTASHVAYTMTQRLQATDTAAHAQPPVLTWHVAYTRPRTLTVTAQVGQTVALRLATDQQQLHIYRQLGGATVRAFAGPVTIDTTPELADDPVAGLMLGETPLNSQVDFLAMQGVKGIPTAQQEEIILTYPDDHETLHLFVDIQHKTVLRAETVTTDGKQTLTAVRTYTLVTVQ